MKIKNKTGSSGYSPEETGESSSLIGKLTNVRTGYARLAIFLLAVNCAFTGYIVYSLNKANSAAVEAAQQTSPVTQTQTSSQGAQSGEDSVTQPTPKN
jgi:hypothetical protein